AADRGGKGIDNLSNGIRQLAAGRSPMSLSRHPMDHASRRALNRTKERSVSVCGRLAPFILIHQPVCDMTCRAKRSVTRFYEAAFKMGAVMWFRRKLITAPANSQPDAGSSRCDPLLATPRCDAWRYNARTGSSASPLLQPGRAPSPWFVAYRTSNKSTDWV